MRALLLATLAIAASACGTPGARVIEAADARDDGATVVLVHGLSRRSGSLMAIGEALLAQGYRVCRIDYPSMSEPPEAIVTGFTEHVRDCAPADARLHFVTHSLGGIVLRAWVRETAPAAIGRVVMLAPPNQGTELADIAARSALLSAVLGPAAGHLGTGPGSLPRRLGPADFELGIIAGDRSLHPLGTFVLEGPNDGTVTAASARLAGMRDFATVRRTHSFLMDSPEVIEEVLAFLASGCFSRRLGNVSYDPDTVCAAALAAP